MPREDGRAPVRRAKTRILGEFRRPVNGGAPPIIPQNRNAIPAETIRGLTSTFAADAAPTNVAFDRVSIGVYRASPRTLQRFDSDNSKPPSTTSPVGLSKFTPASPNVCLEMLRTTM